MHTLAFFRPFGVALLFAGFDPDHGSQLFHMDPSGTYVQYDAKAIGSGSEGAQQSLQVNTKIYSDHLNAGQVRHSNGLNMSSWQLVWYSN